MTDKINELKLRLRKATHPTEVSKLIRLIKQEESKKEAK
ncbi:hypothetical protein [Pectobacterium phage PcaP2EGY]